MRAAIDIGTNSVRLLVANTVSGKIQPVAKDLITTRLGEGVGASGILSVEAIDRTIMAITEMVHQAHQYTNHLTVVATSAVRDAGNRQDFLTLCRQQAKVDVCVLTGGQEAQLSYAGAVGGQHDERESMLIDIGGGSTELAQGIGKKLIAWQSFNVGAVRLSEMFAAQANGRIDIAIVLHWLANFWQEQPKWHQSSLQGVGGTITSLAAIAQGLIIYDQEKVHGYKLTVTKIQTLLQDLAVMTLDERKQVAGLQPSRADIICFGAAILYSVLKWLKANEILVSEQDILEGILACSSNNSVISDNV